MKTKSKKMMSLSRETLYHVVGGSLSPRPRTYGCPSVDTVSCLPPKSVGCFTETQ